MHDSAATGSLVAAAEEAARRAGAAAVHRVRVRVGALSGITPGHLRDHYEAVVAGTILDGSVLEVVAGPDGVAALDDPDAQGVRLLGVDVAGP